jgi:hydroxymethylglutaryl-CoA lyase
MMNEHVTVFEVAPRDGLQNEAIQIATEDKIQFVDMLSECGFAKIEVTSFVSPKWVPQLGDAAEVMGRITRRNGVSYAVLTPNLRGFEAARAAGADEVAIFSSASEGFSRANINCSIAESLERFLPVIDAARATDTLVRGYISCVTDCPFDGPTAPGKVAEVANLLLEMGCYEISLGDTLGSGTRETTNCMLDAVLERVPASQVAGHYHDTGGRALDNIRISLERGVRTFDASVGGLGGCPYAPGARGNVATEAVVELLESLGFSTGIDKQRVAEAAEFARNLRTTE